MLEQVHFALQYLATTGKCFLKHKPDDSHTNVGYKTENHSFETWSLNNSGEKLVLSLEDFTLRWTKNDALQLPLDGKTHKEVIAFLEDTSRQLGFAKNYAFELHYELPFSWDDQYTFTYTREALTEIIQLRNLANDAIHTFLAQAKLQSDIRVWPHHFDTGAFASIENPEIAVGLGMAVPDTMINGHYFYISGYRGHDGLDTSQFKTLTHGEWKNEGFKGAVLPVGNTDIDAIALFFQEALKAYLV